MANEIKVIYTSGKILKYGAYQPDGTVRTAAGTALTEQVGTGYYYATDANILAGDTVRVTEGGVYRGGNEYQPEVDVAAIAKDITAPPNLRDMYNGLGITGPNFPAKQSQLDQLAITGSAVNKSYDSVDVVSGVAVGSPDNTIAFDQVYYQVTENGAGAILIDFDFLIGSDGVATAFTFKGRLQESNPQDQEMIVQAYNYNTTDWDQIGKFAGNVGTPVDLADSWDLFTSHVGIDDPNRGKVQIRFVGTGLSAGDALFIDQIFTSYTVISRTVGYAGGLAYIDTENGYTGTELYVNGVADHKSKTWTEVLAIMTGMGLNGVEVSQGSSITLAVDLLNTAVRGLDYILLPDGYQIDNCTIVGAVLPLGVIAGNGGSLLLETCKIGNITVPEIAIVGCALAGKITASESGTYFTDRCASAIAGTDTPEFDFNSIEDIFLNLRHYSGGMKLSNMIASSVVSVEGHGQLVIDASCEGGTISVRGHFQITDLTHGKVTIHDNANFKDLVIAHGFVLSSTINTVSLGGDHVSSNNGAYDPCKITITAGTGEGQSRMGYQYIGVSKTLVLDRDWKTLPDTTSEFQITADPGREHVNEGLAQGGTINTIVLNALASSVSEIYTDQVVFLKSGQGADQSSPIIAYDGPTRTATLGKNWADGIPDATTAYAMLPEYAKTGESIAEALMAYSGFTEGDMTYSELCQIMAAMQAGNWRVKTLDNTAQELLDADDNATVILEQHVTEGDAVRTITLKI
jgi:hypothetical protein